MKCLFFLRLGEHWHGEGGVRPDASGQGGSGPGSDQDGTRVSPGDRRWGVRFDIERRPARQASSTNPS
ncbi:hypothetical protein CK489_28525 [Bradyrhizobium sp. UFLA03-84]|nr:hypothetical protein CK489_28525 [Bradyrhizobium sp. UFLA03-84]